MTYLTGAKNYLKINSAKIALAALALAFLAASFFTGQKPFLIIGGLLAVALSVQIFRNPYLGILLIGFFLPFERIGSYQLGQITIRPSQVLAMAVIVGWLIYRLSRKSFPLKNNPLFFPLLLFLLINVVSLTNTENMGRSLAVLAYTLFTIILSLVLPQLITKKEQLEKLIKIILVSAFLVSAFGIFQFLGDTMGLPQNITGLRSLFTKQVFGFPRIQSTALEPLYFANYLLIPLGLIVSFFSGKDTKFRYTTLALLLVLLGTNLVLTVSRGGYLAFAALVITVGAFYFKNLFTFKKIFFLAVAVLAIYFAAIRFLGMGDRLNLFVFTEHVTNVFYGAAYNERKETIETALTGFQQHPLVGIGVGAFGPYSAVHPYVMPKDGWGIVNNEFIELLSETGILGLAAFLVIIFIIIFRSLKAIQVSRDKYLKAIMIGLLASFIGVLVQYQTFSILYIMHVWFLVGLIIAVQNIIINKSGAPQIT